MKQNHSSQGQLISQAILKYAQGSNVVDRVKVCKACGGPIKKKYRIYQNLITVVQCQDCGLEFVEETFHEEALAGLYNEILRKSNKHSKLRLERETIFNSWLDEIEQIVPIKGLKLLDVGCGPGDFLQIAKERGCQAFGIDISEVQAQKAQNMGLDVRSRKIESLPEMNFYDVVTFWDVIEHVQDPKETIEAIHRVLVPGGIFALSTPNGGSAWDLLASLLYYASAGWATFLLERRFSMGHLQIFRQDNLTALLKMSGFKIMKSRIFSNYKSEFSRYLEQFLQNRFLISVLANLLKEMDQFHLLPKNKMIIFAISVPQTN